MAEVLRAEGIRVSAGGQRLLDVDHLAIGDGDATVILGPNGAGKSLLLRILHGLVPPDQGRVVFPGGTRPRQAMVFQRPVMLRRSVRGNVAFALKATGAGREGLWQRADQLLHIGGLGDKGRQPARTLSGGEMQRLALIRALATDPQILFLDEPTANLDPGATQQIERLVLQIVRDGTKVVMVTHDIGQARRLAGEIMFCHQGRILEKSPAEEFFRQPVTHEASAYLSNELLV